MEAQIKVSGSLEKPSQRSAMLTNRGGVFRKETHPINRPGGGWGKRSTGFPDIRFLKQRYVTKKEFLKSARLRGDGRDAGEEGNGSEKS